MKKLILLAFIASTPILANDGLISGIPPLAITSMPTLQVGLSTAITSGKTFRELQELRLDAIDYLADGNPLFAEKMNLIIEHNPEFEDLLYDKYDGSLEEFAKALLKLDMTDKQGF